MRAFLLLICVCAIALSACALVDDESEADECAGAPFGSGYTLSPGPPIHDGYYSTVECAAICDGIDRCAPVIEQRSQPRFRCGAPPPDSCGPRHMPRPNVKGACDADGFDVTFGRTLDGEIADCRLACGPRVSKCRLTGTDPDGQPRYRCGEDVPEGCPR